jgi:hypothetical protein
MKITIQPYTYRVLYESGKTDILGKRTKRTESEMMEAE